MKKPEIQAVAGRVLLTWAEPQVTIEFSRLHEHSDGRVTAEICVRCHCEGVEPHLHQAQMNLSSGPAREKLAQQLRKRYDVDWDTMLEQACVLTLQHMRQGEPVEWLDSETDPPPLVWMAEPLLLDRQPTLTYADGGTGKSYLGLLLALIVGTCWEDNPLGVIPPLNPQRSLVLDYETSRDTTMRRWAMMARGCNRPRSWLGYRRCLVPLASEVETVQRIIVDQEIDLVIVDSLFGAAGGDLNENATAQMFYQAMRPLPVTWLMLAHTSKNASGKATPFGSAFWWNMSRLVFELKKSQEVGESEQSVGMFSRKANESKLVQPRGYRLQFDETAVTASAERIQNVADFAADLSLGSRIMTELQRGLMTHKDLAEELQEKPEAIRRTLARLADKHLVVHVSRDQWGVVARTEADANKA